MKLYIKQRKLIKVTFSIKSMPNQSNQVVKSSLNYCFASNAILA